MKTESELGGIATNLHYMANSLELHAYLAAAAKELRTVQIDALREARGIVETSVRYYKSNVAEDNELEDHVRHASLAALNKLIRELELR